MKAHQRIQREKLMRRSAFGAEAGVATPEELDAAMLTMDLDGNGTVSLAEFREWWDGKGGWSYAEDPTQWEP